MAAWGSAPGLAQRRTVSAEGAIHCGAIRFEFRANRCVDSRFQRLSFIPSKSWGDAPGSYEFALLALDRCAEDSARYNDQRPSCRLLKQASQAARNRATSD